jgi:hypothetical protein
MVVVRANFLARLAVPLDGGGSIGGERVFGDNKTWRGAVVMIVGAALFGALQGMVFGEGAKASGLACMDYEALGRRVTGTVGPLGFAIGYAETNLVLGLGYVLGELPNSFLKRRVGIIPGRTTAGAVGTFFFLLDQADSIIMALLLGRIVFGFDWALVAVGSVCLTALHLFLNGTLYLTKVRRNL